MRRLQLLLVLAMALPVVFLTAAASANPGDPDYDIDNGHFYTQANGHTPGTSTTGFAITNADGIPFWDEFQRLGGPEVLGYPVSQRFTYDGLATQAMQKAVLQWQPEAQQVTLVDTLDLLNDKGMNGWLFDLRKIPEPFDASADAGLSRDQVVQRHQAMLDQNEAIKRVYFADPDPISHFGLPVAYADEDNSFVVRAQKATFRYWNTDTIRAKAGEVTVSYGAEIAKQAGLWPSQAMVAEQSPLAEVALAPTSTPRPTAAPARTAAPAAAPTAKPAAPAATPATAAGTGSTACLSCHGPFEKIAAASANYVFPNGEKSNPHRYLPHDSKTVPDCTNCHASHPIPPTAGDITAMGKPKTDSCFTCHHTGNLQCGTCHAVR